MEATVKVITFPEFRPLKGIGYTRVHLKRLEAAGLFPMHIEIGPGRIAWIEAEIDEYLEARVTARVAPPALGRAGARPAIDERVRSSSAARAPADAPALAARPTEPAPARRGSGRPPGSRPTAPGV
jgi:prophage regulatory protein